MPTRNFSAIACLATHFIATPALAQSYEPGAIFQSCNDCPEMVVVPAGRFMMGSPGDEKGRETKEGPQHEVSIADNFAVSRYEITRREFHAFVRASNYDAGNECFTLENKKARVRSPRNYANPGFSQTDRHPVTCVSWRDARAYVAWLRRKTSLKYRMLSEAEWEYAARAGSQEPYFFGSNLKDLCTYANGADRNTSFPDANGTCSDGARKYGTTAVGSYLPNAFGLHDMLGNLFEWVDDCWHKYYIGAPDDGSVWKRHGDCTMRVLRGSGFDGSPSALRVAARVSWYRSARLQINGIRVAMTLPKRR